MRYVYDDTFLTNSVVADEFQRYEDTALNEVSKMNVSDDFYVEKLVVTRAYMIAARTQIEADGMSEKYKVYEKEFERYLKDAMMAANNDGGILDDRTVFSVKVART